MYPKTNEYIKKNGDIQNSLDISKKYTQKYSTLKTKFIVFL